MISGSKIGINFYAKTPVVPTTISLLIKIYSDYNLEILVVDASVDFPSINAVITCF